MKPGLYKIIKTTYRAGLLLACRVGDTTKERLFPAEDLLLIVSSDTVAKTSSKTYCNVTVLCRDGVFCKGTIEESSLEPVVVDFSQGGR